jgi:hypothetical protein
MRQRAVIWVGAAGFAAIALVVGINWIIQCAEQQGKAAALRDHMAPLALTILAEGLFATDYEGVALPEGDIRDLYRWMLANRWIVKYHWGDKLHWLADPQVGTFRDGWGRELVYRFPPRRRDVLFEFYSVGPNGIDDGGGGDDVDCGRSLALADIATHYFKDGIVDTNWFWHNLGRLERDPKSRRIIAAPPERFQAVQPSPSLKMVHENSLP